MNRKPVNIPIGLADYFIENRLDKEFHTYMLLRKTKHFHNFSYASVAKYLKVHKNTAKRHIKTLMQHGLVSLNENQTMLTPLGCEKAKRIFGQSREQKKVVSVQPIKKSLTLKYIPYRSNLRQQEYNQNKLTNIASKMNDPKSSIKKRKLCYKKLKTASKKTCHEFSNIVGSAVAFIDEETYVGLSHQKAGNIINRSKMTARRVVKQFEQLGLIKIEQKFLKSEKTFSRSDFNFLRKFELIPYYSRLKNDGVIAVQLINRVSLLDGIASRN